MIKRILVPTDGSAASSSGAAYAVGLAQQYVARLHGLHVIDVRLLEGPFLRDISSSLGVEPYGNYLTGIGDILRERGKAVLAAFHDLCADANVEADSSLDSGLIAHCIVERSELSDLIVMGRSGEHSGFLAGLLGSTAQAVIRRAHCPVLVTGRAEAGLRRFLVAYDGSVHAKKALQMAAALAETWGVPFDVLVVGETGIEGRFSEARSYLEAHEVEAEYISRTGDPSESIVAVAAEHAADLVVMGAYGHTKVRELVVGSTTDYAIHHAPCPVLLTR